MSRRNSTEIVHEGWLTKSPPIKRIWRARWRRRWFVLRQTGDLPGQYFLEYYTDRQCLKLKGRVDLDQCDQVDLGLQFENRRYKYLKHLFDLRTPKRTYYLAADTEADMNKWVDCVCQVCGLKSDNHEEDYYTFSPPLLEGEEEEEEGGSERSSSALSMSTASTCTSSTTNTSTPYILMSECYSGRPPPAVALALRRAERPVKVQDQPQPVQDEFYDAPRRLQPPPALDLTSQSPCSLPRSVSPPQSPGTDSMVSEEDWQHHSLAGPGVNWSTFPRDSDSVSASSEMGAWIVARRFSRVCTLQEAEAVNELEPPPPRPPKPTHLAEPASSGYLNLPPSPTPRLTPGTEPPAPTADDMYDFPRSHHTHQSSGGSTGGVNCYTNAAPSSSGGVVFRYDFASPAAAAAAASVGDETEPSTPKSETGSQGGVGAVYSNLPSPLAPPCVNRELKPGRRLSDCSNEPSPGGPLSSPAPNVDRKLKPRGKLQPDSPRPADLCPIPLMPAPGVHEASGSRRKPRAAPSPTPPGQGVTPASSQSTLQRDGYSSCSDSETCFRDSGDEDADFYYMRDIGGKKSFEKKRLDKVKYLDLDLEMGSAKARPKPKPKPKPVKVPAGPTIYNTVDFVKTKAFNRTRQEVELERQSPSSAAAVPS